MDRLLVVIATDRASALYWDTRDAVVAASPGFAVAAHYRFGAELARWPASLGRDDRPPSPGFWVWEGYLYLRDTELVVTGEAWRLPTVYELEAVAQGLNPWADHPVPVALPSAGDNVIRLPERTGAQTATSCDDPRPA